MGLKIQTKNALFLGLLCSLIYLTVYISRNVLSAVSPEMLTDNIFDENIIGTMSSIFFFAYAVGQLLNGLLGDIVHSKYMISIGLIVAGVSSFIIPEFNQRIYIYILYGIMGFALSMIYGPMTKTIDENTTHSLAVKCNLGLNFSSYFGAPIAGLLAIIFIWKTTFKTSGFILVTVGIICYILFTYFERKDIITYRQNNKETKSNTFSSPIKTLVSRSIIKFTFVSILTGVIRTSVMFWLPTYLLQYLSFGERQSTTIFTVISLIISVGSFAAAFIYKLLKNSINKTLLFSFALSAVLFLATVIVKHEIVNIILLVLAIMASNCAATMMWSFYCPSLADTGLVSSATGYLDFISYMSAAISSKLFANAVGGIGWGGLIMVWFALMLAGVIISIPYKKRCEI